jgi:hypothetical protein
MSIFLEFPSIEDYPVYSKSTENEQEDGLLPAGAFNWLLTLQFSALASPELLPFKAAQVGQDSENPV